MWNSGGSPKKIIDRIGDMSITPVHFRFLAPGHSNIVPRFMWMIQLRFLG